MCLILCPLGSEMNNGKEKPSTETAKYSEREIRRRKIPNWGIEMLLTEVNMDTTK